MPRQFLRKIKKRVTKKYQDINPEDVFIDAANIPGFDTDRFEGRMEKPMGTGTFLLFKGVLILVMVMLVGRLSYLGIVKGAQYREISQNNSLTRTTLFANRGVILDRTGEILASNAVKPSGADFAGRVYPDDEGLAHVVGYVKYPQKDSSGRYYDQTYKGVDGVERVYNDALTGVNGLKITETDALGRVISESALKRPEDGKALTLAIDAGVTREMYAAMKEIATERGFTGGAGVIMNVRTGEILALASYPEYDQNLLTSRSDTSLIKKTLNDTSTPLLNRAVSGLYTPGSIVKPIMSLGALNEKVIDPLKKILSTGALTLPNPYDPEHPTIFRDWKAHGWVDMRDAIAVSSDVYFYEVGGGFQDQKGLGIENIDKYFSMFGMETKTGIDLPGEKSGVIASIAWKEKNFPGDPWRIGNTYHTSIGQYGTQVTPLEAVRWVGAIANGGKMLIPSVLLGGRPENERVSSTVMLPEEYYRIVREGMRQGVAGENGVVKTLNSPSIHIAAKTGTAELGAKKQFVNSWVTGFFPYENPTYAFALIMEKGPVTNTVGAPSVMRKVIDWMAIYAPEYFE